MWTLLWKVKPTDFGINPDIHKGLDRSDLSFLRSSELSPFADTKLYLTGKRMPNPRVS